MTTLPATLAARLARAHDAGALLISGSLPELCEAGVAWQVQRASEDHRVAAGAELAQPRVEPEIASSWGRTWIRSG